ncbi:MAG: hypothetical protein A2580_06485 [Hydrogenophilales bacterium RIFOXYD1_FULL_62_11]|nr:MAG: hypothetical protein A2580_06485 [Hydrogenophilales bacterium RIFOXYD1_FULL_62_11]
MNAFHKLAVIKLLVGTQSISNTNCFQPGIHPQRPSPKSLNDDVIEISDFNPDSRIVAKLRIAWLEIHFFKPIRKRTLNCCN